VAAGRKGVFSRVAEARAAAAKANRMRAGRIRGERVPSLDGSTASDSVADITRAQPTALVSKIVCTAISVLYLYPDLKLISVFYFTYTFSVIGMTIMSP
jgi:hypothetical protein